MSGKMTRSVKMPVDVTWLVTFLVVAGIFILSLWVIKDKNNNEAFSNEEIIVGADFKDFTAVGFDETRYDADLFKGHKLNMVNVWGTFCHPCIEEMPGLCELSKEYESDRLKVIGICADTVEAGSYDETNIDKAKSIINATGVTYLNLMPSLELSKGILDDIQFYPTTFIIDEEGNVIDIISGAKSKEEWKKIINEILSKQ